MPRRGVNRSEMIKDLRAQKDMYERVFYSTLRSSIERVSQATLLSSKYSALAQSMRGASAG